jgi:mono/diheme cytochrome c family protein
MRARLVAVAAALGAGAAAQDVYEPGAREFRESCAGCHGADARGGGPVAELLTVPVPDLTRMAERREGRLDPLELLAVIDGRAGVRAHGGPMPIWGSRYRAEAELYAEPAEAELATRMRLLALAFYLMSIQRGGYPTGYAPDAGTDD